MAISASSCYISADRNFEPMQNMAANGNLIIDIGIIDWLLGTIGGIGVVPDTLSVTVSKVSTGNLMTSVADPNFQIELFCHRLPLVTECPRVSFLSILHRKTILIITYVSLISRNPNNLFIQRLRYFFNLMAFRSFKKKKLKFI